MTETGLRLRPAAQRPLALDVSARTVLVSMETVRAVLGVDADSINARIESGAIRWVFDVAVGTVADREVRELRFWAKEFIAPDTMDRGQYNPAKVVAEILGKRERYRGTEIAQLLLVSRPTILRLVVNGELAGNIISGVIQVPRAALEKFLLSRLLENTLAAGETPTPMNAHIKTHADEHPAAFIVSVGDDVRRLTSNSETRSQKLKTSQSLVTSSPTPIPCPKSAAHAPASPATTMQRRRSGNSTAPASLPGAVSLIDPR